MTSEINYTSLMSGSSTAINQLYDVLLPRLKSWLLRNNGDKEDALDLLHDALSSLIIKHHKGGNQNVKDIEAYIFQMCKYLWYGILKKRKTISTVTIEEKITDTTEANSLDTMIATEQEYIKYQLLESSFDKLSALCKKLLELVKQGKKAKQIAEDLNMNGQSTVNRRKAACLDSWRKYISEDPQYHLINDYD